MDENQELLPCWSCGEQPSAVDFGDDRVSAWWIVCANSQCSQSRAVPYSTLPACVAAWNTRSDTDAAMLARMLAGEQAAHHETHHSLDKVETALSMVQRNDKAWQALVSQRQQEIEAALVRLSAYHIAQQYIIDHEMEPYGECRYCQAGEEPLANGELYCDHEAWCPSAILATLGEDTTQTVDVVQRYEIAQSWSRRWKAAAKKLHDLRAIAIERATWNENRLAEERDKSARLNVQLLESERRSAAIRDLADSLMPWLPPMYRAELEALVSDSGTDTYVQDLLKTARAHRAVVRNPESNYPYEKTLEALESAALQQEPS